MLKVKTMKIFQEAIETVDAETKGYAAYYMLNCAHPTHFSMNFEEGN